ncbi:hypothetical protein HORIV_40330 [Vreelandella olivaria]|uniref:Helicase ATP-binding domain-containing protein n=1 Tax=Vreelandella olivaria TaxID=390919 RepID=A0ABN5WXT4_9GAMM|nr:hypothetical protein HORIV_40330 [Halomonas olivaria]
MDILVATPGRLLDLAHQRALHFDELKVMVLDEADRMVDMGFVDDIKKIIDRLPEDRQNLLFSATMTDDVRALAYDFSDSKMTDLADEISISPNLRAAANVQQWLITVDKDTKSALLSHLINEQKWDQALIFTEKNTMQPSLLLNWKNAASQRIPFMAIEAKRCAKRFWLSSNLAS